MRVNMSCRYALSRLRRCFWFLVVFWPMKACVWLQFEIPTCVGACFCFVGISRDTKNLAAVGPHPLGWGHGQTHRYAPFGAYLWVWPCPLKRWIWSLSVNECRHSSPGEAKNGEALGPCSLGMGHGCSPKTRLSLYVLLCEIWSFYVKDCRHNYTEPHKLDSAGSHPLQWGRADRWNTPFPTCVTTPNIVPICAEHPNHCFT